MTSLRLLGLGAVFCVAGGVSACGITDKMDTTNQQVRETNSQVRDTNDKLDATNKTISDVDTNTKTMTVSTLDMDEKIDETNRVISSTNGKIDETNQAVHETNTKIDRTNAAIDKTNQTMGQMSSDMQEMKSSTRDLDEKMGAMESDMKDMKSATSEMDQKMGVTNAAIHKQILVGAMQELLKPENTRYLLPPTALLPAGETFAEEATPDELIQLTYVYLKDIDEVQPDDSQKQPNGQYPPSLILEMDHDKLAKLTVLEVLAGFMPRPKVEQLVDEQITQGGRYDTTAFSFLMLRTLFIRDLMLKEDLFSGKLDNLGKVREGIDRVASLDWIARLPVAGQVEVKTTGMLNPDDNIDEKLEPRLTVPMWDRLASALETELDPAKVGSSPDTEDRIAQMKATVKRYQDSWKPAPKPH